MASFFPRYCTRINSRDGTKLMVEALVEIATAPAGILLIATAIIMLIGVAL